jgi:hypothetical protein
VKIAWPNKTPHYFGKFRTKAEAEWWIEEHRWPTQRKEPNSEEADDFEPNDCGQQDATDNQ